MALGLPLSLRLLLVVLGTTLLEVSKATADGDVLTILSTNTYLLEVKYLVSIAAKPNIEERRDGYIRWFRGLTADQIPDVVALSEILSEDGDALVKSLCSESWQRNRPDFKTLECDPSSKFETATAVVNEVASFDPMKSGGVVVLSKKGIKMLHAQDQKFEEAAGNEKMNQKGFWAVQVEKAGQKHWVLATHTQAWADARKNAIRKTQFAHMRKYVDDNAATNDRVAFVGDMNIFTDPFTVDGVRYTGDESDSMLTVLGPGDGENKSIGCTLVPRGFWVPLDKNITHSVEIKYNHYVANNPEEVALGNQHFDWVVVPGAGDKFQQPMESKCQFLPMKTNTCFKSDVSDKFTDDLTDHYAIFAQLCYGKHCPAIPTLTGYKGQAGILPHGPDCADSLETKQASCDTGSCCPGSINAADFDLLIQQGLTEHKHRGDFSGRCHAKATNCGACSTPLFGDDVYCLENQVCECNFAQNECKSPNRTATGEGMIISGAKHSFDTAVKSLLAVLGLLSFLVSK